MNFNINQHLTEIVEFAQANLYEGEYTFRIHAHIAEQDVRMTKKVVVE